MKIKIFILLVSFWLLAAQCGQQVIPPPRSVSVHIAAAVGGRLEHPSGAKLLVPAAALSRDTTVTLSNLGYPDPKSGDNYEMLDPYDPVLNVSPAFAVDLGGAKATKDLQLDLRFPERLAQVGTQALQTDHLLFRMTDPSGNPWLRSAGLSEDGRSVFRKIKDELNEPATPHPQNIFQLAYVVSVNLSALLPPILEVPYYWQDNLPWCAPTSLAMVANAHAGGIGGVVSNWDLAGRHQQNETEGTSPPDVIKDAGAPQSLYDWYEWDADLIPSNPFTAYVKRYNLGFNLQDLYGREIDLVFIKIPVPDVDVPPRPVELCNTTHCFVSAGSNNTHIWLHDSSGAFAGSAGIAIQQTWATFRSSAIDLTQSKELLTLIFTNGLRPENQRRGSIVMYENGNRPSDDDGSLLYYTGASPVLRSRWQWDGDPYPKGYYWDDPSGIYPDDPTYGTSFTYIDPPLPGSFHFNLRIANVTTSQRSYTLSVQLRSSAGAVLDSSLFVRTIPAYSWLTADSLITGTLSPSSIRQAGVYSISAWLYEGGILQDFKLVEFRVG